MIQKNIVKFIQYGLETGLIEAGDAVYAANRVLELLRIDALEDAAEADTIFSILMGDKVEPRRDYITAYADFNKIDTFLEREGGAK